MTSPPPRSTAADRVVRWPYCHIGERPAHRPGHGTKSIEPPASAPAAPPFSALCEAEYAALARDVATLDHEFSIVKRVVKLVTPAVVHIESKPLPKYQGLMRVEEAGSGVIVQIGSRDSMC